MGLNFLMLHILKNTDLADHYEGHPFDVFTLESYVDLILKCIENLSPRDRDSSINWRWTERFVDCS